MGLKFLNRKRETPLMPTIDQLTGVDGAEDEGVPDLMMANEDDSDLDYDPNKASNEDSKDNLPDLVEYDSEGSEEDKIQDENVQEGKISP